MKTYIDVEIADSFFEGVIQKDIEQTWDQLSVNDKERYIAMAYNEISEVVYPTIEKAQREQLRVLEVIFLSYDEFIKRKHLRMSGVRKFKHRDWEETFDEKTRAGDGAFGYDKSNTGNVILDL